MFGRMGAVNILKNNVERNSVHRTSGIHGTILVKYFLHLTNRPSGENYYDSFCWNLVSSSLKCLAWKYDQKTSEM